MEPLSFTLSLGVFDVKKNTGLIVAGVIVGAVVLVCGLSGVVAVFASKASKDNAATATAPAAVGEPLKAAKPAGAGLNQPARDGKFEFTVTKIECGVKISIGSMAVTPQGQYCAVSVKVKNIGNEPRMFDASSQYAYNAAGQKYNADTAAGLYLKDAGNAFLENINPGNAVAGTLVYDIPGDAAIKRLELHDSAFSGGVAVTL